MTGEQLWRAAGSERSLRSLECNCSRATTRETLVDANENDAAAFDYDGQGGDDGHDENTTRAVRAHSQFLLFFN